MSNEFHEHLIKSYHIYSLIFDNFNFYCGAQKFYVLFLYGEIQYYL